MEASNQEILKLSPAFKEGFNKGYILRENKPDLALSLRQTKFPESEKEYASGLHAGIDHKEIELTKKKNFSFEKLKEEYKDKLSHTKTTKEKNIDKN